MQRTDFKRLAVELLPVCLRKPVMTSLLRSLMQGIVIAYMEFLSWKEERDKAQWAGMPSARNAERCL